MSVFYHSIYNIAPGEIPTVEVGAIGFLLLGILGLAFMLCATIKHGPVSD